MLLNEVTVAAVAFRFCNYTIPTNFRSQIRIIIIKNIKWPPESNNLGNKYADKTVKIFRMK